MSDNFLILSIYIYIYIYIKKMLFIYFWLQRVLVSLPGLSPVAASGAFSCCGAQA